MYNQSVELWCQVWVSNTCTMYKYYTFTCHKIYPHVLSFNLIVIIWEFLDVTRLNIQWNKMMQGLFRRYFIFNDNVETRLDCQKSNFTLYVHGVIKFLVESCMIAFCIYTVRLIWKITHMFIVTIICRHVQHILLPWN